MTLLFPQQKPAKLLTIELVPATSWFQNARKILTPTEWDVVRKQVYRAAWWVCEICGGKGPKWPVECHEVWSFTDGGLQDGVQTLAGLQALCPSCHMVKHFGFAQIRKREAEAFGHLMNVNKWGEQEARVYVRDAFSLWEARSRKNWTVDVQRLSRYGLDVGSILARVDPRKGEGFESGIPEHDVME